MKVLGVSGSPRRNGNSDVAARTVLEALRDLGETEFIRQHPGLCTDNGGCKVLRTKPPLPQERQWKREW